MVKEELEAVVSKLQERHQQLHDEMLRVEGEFRLASGQLTKLKGDHVNADDQPLIGPAQKTEQDMAAAREAVQAQIATPTSETAPVEAAQPVVEPSAEPQVAPAPEAAPAAPEAPAVEAPVSEPVSEPVSDATSADVAPEATEPAETTPEVSEVSESATGEQESAPQAVDAQAQSVQG